MASVCSCQSLETMLLAERAQRDAGTPPLHDSDSSKTISVELSDDSGVSERVRQSFPSRMNPTAEWSCCHTTGVRSSTQHASR